MSSLLPKCLTEQAVSILGNETVQNLTTPSCQSSHTLLDGSVDFNLGLFATLLANMSVVAYGVNAKRTVAIQCRCGRSLSRLYVFDGSFEPEDRYEGMKIAFGAEHEILKPQRQAARVPQTMDAAAYKSLLVSTEKRATALRGGPIEIGRAHV